MVWLVINKPEEPRKVFLKYRGTTVVIPGDSRASIINNVLTLDKKPVMYEQWYGICMVHNPKYQQEQRESKAFVEDCEENECRICLEEGPGGDGQTRFLRKNGGWGNPNKQLMISKTKMKNKKGKLVDHYEHRWGNPVKQDD